MSLFAELKRRNVIRVAGAYLALGWIVTQITATVAPVMNLPGWIAPVVVWIGVIAFPFVLLFSWVYELTPEGLKRESEIDRSSSITHITARRLDYITIALVVGAVAIYLLDPLAARRESGATQAAATPAAPVAAGQAQATPAAGTASPPQAAAQAADPRSIAVLPFIDMSAARDQDYMSDGIAEELLNLLARVPELKVTSRSSAFAFKGERIDIAEVAKKLNVAHVLEGSVRTSGNRVRITAQLIDARADQHLWSQSYDRTLDDIFAVQDEIAGSVVEQLKIKLLGEAPKARATNPEAYAMYLQARELGRRFTPEAFNQSNAMLERVLEIDPEYAGAWERLGTNYINQSGDMLPEEQGYEMAREAYRKALAIDPALPAGLDGIAWIAMFHDGDLAAAARDYTKVVALAPGDLDVFSNASRLFVCLGRTDSAVAAQEYTARRDPANPLSYANLADAYLRAGRVEDAIATNRLGIVTLGGDRYGARWRTAAAYLVKGDTVAAMAEIQQETSPVLRQFGLAMVHAAQGNRTESDTALEAFDRASVDQMARRYGNAAVRAWRNENDAAFEWLEKVAATQNQNLCGISTDPLLRKLHADPRWEPFLRRIGRAPEQLAAIPFEITIPQ